MISSRFLQDASDPAPAPPGPLTQHKLAPLRWPGAAVPHEKGQTISPTKLASAAHPDVPGPASTSPARQAPAAEAVPAGLQQLLGQVCQSGHPLQCRWDGSLFDPTFSGEPCLTMIARGHGANKVDQNGGDVINEGLRLASAGPAPCLCFCPRA